MRTESSGSVGGSMPCVAIAGGNGFDACRAVVDSQVQGDGTVATY